MDRLTSELIVGYGCMLRPNDIAALLPDAGSLTSEQLADVFVRAEGVEPYEIGTKVHVERLGMLQDKIEQNFDSEIIDIGEIRRWAER